MSVKIERVEYAEKVGVSSVVVQNMIDDMEENGVDIHSLMIVRHGKVACEAYKAPISADDVQMLYSISKSFLSVAYCFAFDEGYITEDAYFLDVFPEYRKFADKKLKQLKISHLLSMTSGKRTARTKKDWLNSFVKSKWDFAPGSDFRYVNDNYYALSAALVKSVGMSVVEYLTPRLFEPLGIDIPFWETSPQNIESGGWGLQLKTEDVAKFILCCSNNGFFNNKQVIPEKWLNKAISKITNTSSSQNETDSMAGYGYGFWKCAGMSNTFRCEGLYSQYAISFGDYDACLVMTSGCAMLQKTLDIVWKYMKNAFIDEGNNSNLIVKIPSSQPYEKSERMNIEKIISGKTYKLNRRLFVDICGFPVSSLTMPVMFFTKDKGGDITDLSFDFDENGCVMSWTENGGYKNKHYISMNGTYSEGKVKIGEMNMNTVACGRWIDDFTFEVIIKPLAAVADRKFVFKFKINKIKMYPDMVPSMDERSKAIGDKLKCILKGKYFEWWIDFLVPKVKYILQPTFYGRTK